MNNGINKQDIDNQPNNADPAENGAQGEKMFTQDEVNNIVSERLKRDREKRSEQLTEDTREKALKDRENRLTCREYIAEKKYKSELLDILDTSDVDRFKADADKLHELYGVQHELEGKRARFTVPMGSIRGIGDDPIRNAFRLK